MRTLAALAVTLLLALAGAPPASAQVPLTVGGVPYVPTPFHVIEAMLELAEVGSRDLVVDLGSGDGRIPLVAAKKYGARGIGVELDANLTAAARNAARSQGVANRTRFVQADLFAFDFRQATVLTLYLLPEMNAKLAPRILGTLAPGARVVTHDFGIGDWPPDAQVTIGVPGKAYGPPSSTLHLWIVPANATGRWHWTHGGRRYELRIAQTFQQLEATATVDGAPAAVTEARLRGDAIVLGLAVGRDGGDLRETFEGRVRGDAIAGTAGGPGGAAKWGAMRTERGRIATSGPAER